MIFMMFAWGNLEAAETITVMAKVTEVPLLLDEDDLVALRHTAHSSEVDRFAAQLSRGLFTSIDKEASLAGK